MAGDRLRGWWWRLGTRRQRLAAWLIAGAVAAGGLLRVETTANEAHDAAETAQRALDRLAETDRVEDARQCVSVWEGRRGVRALLDGIVAAASPAPEVEAAFREDMAERLPDPECDLAEAERVLAERPPREGG